MAVFGQCLEQHQSNVDTALLAYNRARLPDVQAIMTINEVASSQDSGLASQVKHAYPSSVCNPSCPALLVCLTCLSLPFCLLCPVCSPFCSPVPCCVSFLYALCLTFCLPPLRPSRSAWLPCLLSQDLPAMPIMSLLYYVCRQRRACAFELPLNGAWHRLLGHQKSISAVVNRTTYNQASSKHKHAALQLPSQHQQKTPK